MLTALALLLGLTLLVAHPASATVAASLENRASGSTAVAKQLVGKNPRLSEEATRENLPLRYDLASDSPVAARGAVTVTREGLDQVVSHLAQFGEHPPNQAMIERLESQLGSQVSGADANFYLHELSESEYMAEGLSDEAAHAAALESGGVSPFSLYHPEVIQQFPQYFNNAWRAFWGLQ
jgi:filamentous hemagglutinin